MDPTVPKQPVDNNISESRERCSSLFHPGTPYFERAIAVMVDARLTHRDVMLFRHLCVLWADSNQEDHCVAITYPTLAAWIGLKFHGVRDAARHLEEAGYLDIQGTRRPSPSGHGWVTGPTRFTLGRVGS